MIDAVTKTPLHVSTDGGEVAYIRVSVDQLPEVQKLLDGHGVRYWVQENYFSFNGGPFKTVISLYRAMDPTFVQSILDDAH